MSEVVELTDGQIVFAMSDGDRSGARKALFGSANPWRSFAIPAVVLAQAGVQAITQWRNNVRLHAASEVDWALLVMWALLIVGAMFIGLAAYQRWAFAPDAHLFLDDDGVSGTLAGRPVCGKWRDIGNVRDIGDYFVLVKRGVAFARLIVIPKAAVSSPAAFWSKLDERLVAKRALRRTPGSSVIINTAFE